MGAWPWNGNSKLQLLSIKRLALRERDFSEFSDYSGQSFHNLRMSFPYGTRAH